MEFSKKYGDSYEFFDVDITREQKEFVRELKLTSLPHIHIVIGGQTVESFGSGCKKRDYLEERLTANRRRQF